MADNSELGELYGPVGPSRGTLAAWAGLVGALTSLVLMIGVAVWGYKLLMRDVNGIPVVRALEGPMRKAPEDPGGERMAHQGLEVNQVAAAGEAGELNEQLVLAPPVPELLDQDLPMADLGDAPLANLSGPADEAVAEVVDAEVEGADVVNAVANAETVAAASVDLPVVVIPASVQGVSRSLRPPPRPAAMFRRVPAPEAQAAPSAIDAAVASVVGAPLPAAAPAATDAGTAVEVSADSLPVGSRLVQLGAFESPDKARDEWGRIAERFAEVMAGKNRVIQEASAGGKTFYRLRVAGFEDLADARRFCATLVADKTRPLCVPVATR